jgi:hypothetical protein
MAKATAVEFGFEYHDEDLNRGLHNLAGLTALNLTFQEILDGMDSTDNATTPVLVLLPTACPIGYGCQAPSGKLDKEEMKAAFQACHDAVFTWSNAINHLCTKKYEGKSLHLMITNPTTFIDKYIIDAKRKNWKANLAYNIWTVTTSMGIDNKEFITLRAEVQRQAFDQLEDYSQTNDAARIAFERSSANPAGGTSSSDMLTAITSAFSAVGSATVGTSAPDLSTKKCSIAAMKLLSIHKDPNDNWAIHAKLHSRFNMLAEHRVKMGIPMHMHKGMIIFMNNLQENNHNYGTTNTTVQKCDRPGHTLPAPHGSPHQSGTVLT